MYRFGGRIQPSPTSPVPEARFLSKKPSFDRHFDSSKMWFAYPTDKIRICCNPERAALDPSDETETALLATQQVHLSRRSTQCIVLSPQPIPPHVSS